MTSIAKAKKPRTKGEIVQGGCLCGAVTIEIDYPAFWAWHDHSDASRRAHGAAYATYAGCWKSRVRIVGGEDLMSRFRHEATQTTRSFCGVCGTPIMFERGHSPKMVNIPRALFDTRTGREPRYHVGFDQMPDWAYGGAPVGPLKGFPGVMLERKRKRDVQSDLMKF